MTLQDFIKDQRVEHSDSLIAEADIKGVETSLQVTIGPELKKYILEYGYLAFRFSEMYGINGRQGMASDMISQTLYLHKYYPETTQYIALENQGEGDYYVVDGDDLVYEYDTELREIKCLNMKVFEYIAFRFESIKE